MTDTWGRTQINEVAGYWNHDEQLGPGGGSGGGGGGPITVEFWPATNGLRFTSGTIDLSAVDTISFPDSFYQAEAPGSSVILFANGNFTRSAGEIITTTPYLCDMTFPKFQLDGAGTIYDISPAITTNPC